MQAVTSGRGDTVAATGVATTLTVALMIASLVQ